MRFSGPISRRISFGGIAIAGLVAGHCFAHRFFAGPDGPHAHHHQTHSHSPWMLAMTVGLLIALVGSFIDHRVGARRVKLMARAGMLLGVQLTGFVGVSALDRITHSPGTEIGSRAFWAGLALQVMAAALGAVVLAIFRRAIATIERAIGRGRMWGSRSPLLRIPEAIRHVVAPLALATGGPTFRGPPHHL